MAGYAAVVSLKNTINALLNSSSPSTAEMLESAYNQTTSLQQALQCLNDSSTRKRVDHVDGQIRDAAYKLEDVLEFHQLHLISVEMLESAYKQSTSLQHALQSLNDNSSRKRVDHVDGQIRDVAHKLEDVLEFHELNSQEEEVRKEITSFVEAAKKMEKEYIEELASPLTEEDNGSDDAAAIVDFGVEMVGHAYLFNTIRKRLLKKMRPIDSYFCSFLGENGSGRTVRAHLIFEEVGELFECCAWVTLGCTTHEQLKEVVIGILEQVGNNEEAALLLESGEADEEMICTQLYKALDNRRYMIVLDDVRSVEVLTYLLISFPDQSNGSLLLLTTNQQEIAQSAADHIETFVPEGLDDYQYQIMRLFFSRAYPELDEAGRKIIDNCGCRWIPFFKSLVFLNDKTEKTVEEWSKIAADEEHPIFMVGDEISEMTEIIREMQSYNPHIVDQGRGFILEFIFRILDREDFKKMIHPKRFFSKMQIISLVGMCGIGKTTFAKKLIQDESVLSHFDHCVWLTLGPKYQAEQVLMDILTEIYPNADKMHMKEDEQLVRELCVQLSSKRCLIVLDDLWSKEPLHHLKNLFPDIKGITFVTTTTADVVKFGDGDLCYEMPLLDEEESWCLFCEKMFGGGECPPELEKAGRKIVENCEGLPLLILTVAKELLKVERSQQCWNNVASGKEKSVFKNAHDQISKALLPRYQILPQHLKTCFLYIGVFCQKYKIHTSVFTNLLIAEGFLESNIGLLKEEYVAECLSDLVQRSLVMVRRSAFPISEFKTCHLHAVFWHLANTVAMKNEFFHALNSYVDCSEEKMRNQRRLCVRNSILLGFKDVQESTATVTNAHSLLCVSPPQQYAVPIDFDMRLLRVMNAITIRLYEFPIEVVRLLHLRYLGLTFNGMLPTSISNLWKLEYLIVKRHMNIKSFESYWLLPMEIWDMKELKHLEFTGGRLPNPKCGAALPKLRTLLDVSVQSCTEEVLQMIPNLKRLGIRIELAPNGDELLGDSFHCLNNICRLGGLESLKCAVVNPQIRAGVVPPLIMLPQSLKRLSLSGMGYPWEYMNSMVDGLHNLQVLKLKHYAFQGPKWELDRDTNFNGLKSLSIEDTNLVQWKLKVPIWSLEHLCFKHCYKLKEFPIAAKVYILDSIEIVECSPFTVIWAEHTVPELCNCKVKVKAIL